MSSLQGFTQHWFAVRPNYESDEREKTQRRMQTVC